MRTERETHLAPEITEGNRAPVDLVGKGPTGQTMPTQKRHLPDGSDEDEQEQEQQHRLPTSLLPCHYSPPSQLNGNNHPPFHRPSILPSLPAEQDPEWHSKEEDDEEERGGGDRDEDGDEQSAHDDDTEPDEEHDEDPEMEGLKEEGGDGNGVDEWKCDREQESDATTISDNEEKPEFVFVELADIRKEVQCPICLGIIKKTRTVMECLHRFCRECIDKSMRMGNNECPACRTHCASRRSLRDDPNYDALIAALYPDIDKYEEKELAFHEEERTRNKQIQASIAQIFKRQSEALAKRRTLGKETLGPFSTRSQRRPTRRRQSRGGDLLGSEDNEDEQDEKGGKDSSSADERSTEGRQRKRKRRPASRTSQPSTSADFDVGLVENDMEAIRDNRGVSPGLAWNTEMLAWGRGGTRSHTRHGNSSGVNNKSTRSNRMSRLVEYLRSLEEKHDEVDVHIRLISLDSKISLNLRQPYICCRSSVSVKHLCEYVALQTPLQPEEIEILLVKGGQNPIDANLLCPSFLNSELQLLREQETLAGLQASYATSRGCLILAYRQREDL